MSKKIALVGNPNSGKTTLYCSTQGLPTTTQYSFKVDGNSVANFTEPHSRSKLYVYNPSKENIKISITYWYGDFNPSFLGLSDITHDLIRSLPFLKYINCFKD